MVNVLNVRIVHIILTQYVHCSVIAGLHLSTLYILSKLPQCLFFACFFFLPDFILVNNDFSMNFYHSKEYGYRNSTQ